MARIPSLKQRRSEARFRNWLFPWIYNSATPSANQTFNPISETNLLQTCKGLTLPCKSISFIEYKQKSQKHKYIENISKQTILTAINGSKSIDTEGELTNFILSQCFGQCLSLKQSSRNKFWIKKISQNVLIGTTPFIKYSNVPLSFRILTEKRAGGWDCLNI